LISAGRLPEPMRNYLSTAHIDGSRVLISRTGYTGEPICFELFIARKDVAAIWEAFIDKGVRPIGLGARDTLRLEAALPLYGHELGIGPENREIPVYSCPLARFAVSLSEAKGRFVGREALEEQFAVYRRIVKHNSARDSAQDHDRPEALPRMIRLFELRDRGIARRGAEVFLGDRRVGWVTSGTMAPYWIFEAEGLSSVPTDRSDRRAIGMALIDSRIEEQTEIRIDVRGKRLRALAVPYLLRAEAPPFARPVLWTGAAEATG